MIDDDDFDGAFGGFQFQSKLLCNGCEDGSTVGYIRIRGVIQRSFLPLQMEIVCSGQTSLIDDRPAHGSGNVCGQCYDAHALSVESSIYSVLRVTKSAKRQVCGLARISGSPRRSIQAVKKSG